MRSLEKNMTTLWKVSELGMQNEIDSDGNLTGSKIMTFSIPTKIGIELVPSTSDIVQKLFGTDASFDMISSSVGVVLKEHDLLFYSEPTSNFSTTYDYSVSSIAKSLNSFVYGLEKRT